MECFSVPFSMGSCVFKLCDVQGVVVMVIHNILVPSLTNMLKIYAGMFHTEVHTASYLSSYM